MAYELKASAGAVPNKAVASTPGVSNYAEFFPGMDKSWALTFMVNDTDVPTGRPAGSLAWAGLANLCNWIDRKNGIGGFWATQILPFVDAPSVGGYLELETAVYRDTRGRLIHDCDRPRLRRLPTIPASIRYRAIYRNENRVRTGHADARAITAKQIRSDDAVVILPGITSRAARRDHVPCRSPTSHFATL